MKESIVSLKEYFVRGLRVSDQQPTNTPSLTQAQGVLLEDGALRTHPSWGDLDLSALSCTFPYPQIFDLTMCTLVCTPGEIYEYENESLTLALDSLTPGACWSCADFGLFLVLTNGKQTVVRWGDSLSWEVVSDGSIPVGTSICRVGGQIVVGAPRVNYDAKDNLIEPM